MRIKFNPLIKKPQLNLKKNLSASHFLLALLIVFIWGTNFVIIKEVLATLPPLLFATLRFCLVFLPAALFLRRPRVPLWHLASYGILIGVGQFGMIYIAMTQYISPGLASLVVQTQVFFTIGLAMYFSGERIKPFQILALVLAAGGLAVIIQHTDGATTPLGLLMVMIAAMSWASANIINRYSAKIDPSLNMLSFVVWSSIFAVPILLILSLGLEGLPAIQLGLANMSPATWLGVLWQTAANTMFGYAAWAWLLARYPAATVSPLSLLVPIFGMGASALYLAEPLPAWKIIAASLILAGLALNIIWPIVQHKFNRSNHD